MTTEATTPTPAAAPTAAPTPASTTPAPPPAKAKRKRKSPVDTAKDYRTTNLPHIKDGDVWSASSGGWASIPRPAGLIATVVIKEAHKAMLGGSSAAGTTYMTLWLHWQGNGMSRIESEADAALESGYGGERGITTFRRHLRTLKDLGFIDYLEEGRGRVKWVALFNPYQVVKKLLQGGHISKPTYSLVSERADAIGSAGEFDGPAEPAPSSEA